MTELLDIGNRALQIMGSRTNMTQAEFTTVNSAGQVGTSNEAIQCNLAIVKLRDELNRMAPWDCTTAYANLTYICSLPTTPENATAGAPLWQPGTPAPPWTYEYQYPVDCLRARKIIPQYTAQVGGTPIYPAGTATGAAQVGWTGPALKFKISTDSFFGVNAATVAVGGLGYSVGDILILAQPTYTFQQNSAPTNQTPAYTTFAMTVGAPAVLQVTSIGAGGVITGVSVVNQITGETSSPSGAPTTPISGSYYSVPANPVGTSNSLSATNPGLPSAGSGATFNLTFTSTVQPQRVVLCNQEQAILCYNKQVVDPNVMDNLFQDAWVHLLASRLCYQLSGDKEKANRILADVNNVITEARKADGNEGITVNDVTPDFLRIRGNYGGPNYEFSPNMAFDWGDFYSPY